MAGIWALAAVTAAAGPKDRLNVILIVVDALRADHLGCYGYALNTTPVIDRLARNALVGTNVSAQSNWTAPAMASLMTGTYPSVHKITKSPEDAQDRNAILPRSLRILPEPFQARGYFTAAVSSCGWVSPNSGYGKGFDEFRLVERNDEVIVRSAIDLLRPKTESPFLLYLHLLDVHDYFDLHKAIPAFGREPISVPATMKMLAAKPRAEIYNWLGAPPETVEITAADIAYLQARYDAFLNQTDRLLGGLVDFLGERKVLERTLVVITADHGEDFFEHKQFIHGGDSLSPEVLRIPLIVHNSGLFPKRKTFADPAESLDIVPTILDLVRLEGFRAEGLEQLQGRSLMTRPRRRVILSEADGKRKIVSENWSYVRSEAAGKIELYDLARDPGELRNVAAENQKIVKKMADLLAKKLAGSLSLSAKILPEDGPMDEATKKALKSLGYIK